MENINIPCPKRYMSIRDEVPVELFTEPIRRTRIAATHKYWDRLLAVNSISQGQEGLIDVVAIAVHVEDLYNCGVQFDEVLIGRSYQLHIWNEDADDSYYKGLKETGTGTELFGDYYGCTMECIDIQFRFMGYKVAVSAGDCHSTRVVHLVGTEEECTEVVERSEGTIKYMSADSFSSERHPIYYRRR